MEIVLTINVKYQANGVSREELCGLLSSAAKHLYNEGLLTGETAAEVDEWKWKVETVTK